MIPPPAALSPLLTLDNNLLLSCLVAGGLLGAVDLSRLERTHSAFRAPMPERATTTTKTLHGRHITTVDAPTVAEEAARLLFLARPEHYRATVVSLLPRSTETNKHQLHRCGVPAEHAELVKFCLCAG